MATVKDLLEARLQLDGDKPFILFRDWKITFKEFYEQSVKYANFFLNYKQEGKPFHIAIMMYNYPEFLYAFGGCALSGATLVGINTGLKGEKLAKVLDESNSLLILTDNTNFKSDEQTNLEKLAGVEFNLKNNIFTHGRVEGYQAIGDVLISTGARPTIEIEDNTPLMIIYTSGTTGLPRGIVNNQKKFVDHGLLCSKVLKQYGIEKLGTCYVNMPLFHSNSMFLAISWALATGGKIGLREKFSSREFWNDVKKYNATFWNYVGTPMNYLLNKKEFFCGNDSLKLAVGNGSTSEIQLAFKEEFGLQEVIEVYGQTETGLVTKRTTYDINKEPKGSIGKLPPEVKILRIKSNDRGEEHISDEECAPGEIGEIVEFGSLAARFTEYYENPEATQAKKGPTGDRYYTDDLGEVDENGYFYFRGRKGDWIRKKGENFSAFEIEEVLNQCPGVVLSAAYNVPHPESDDYCMVALELKDESNFNLKEFYGFCEKNLGDEKWIPDFVRITKLEQTETQKVIKNPLKAEHINLEELTKKGSKIFWRGDKEKDFKEFKINDYLALLEKYELNGRTKFLIVQEQRYK